MSPTDIAPYLVSGIVAVITAVLTHRRATKSHSSTVIIDQQTLLNDTYEKVLGIVNEQLSRQNANHENERRDWEMKEVALNMKIENQNVEILQLMQKVTRLEQQVNGGPTAPGDFLEAARERIEKRNGGDLPT